jgi:hypothetical protein
VSTSDIVGTSSLASVNHERGRLDECTRRGKAAFTGGRQQTRSGSAKLKCSRTAVV